MNKRQIESLKNVTQGQRDLACAEMEMWDRDTWERWDERRKALVRDSAQIDDCDAQWVAYLQIRGTAKIVEKSN